MPMKSLITILLFATTACLHAQNLLEINGRVVESGGNTPVAFANIHVKNTGIGTAANPEGEFQLRTSHAVTDSMLIISCLGYNSAQITIRDIDAKKQLVVTLKPSVETLKTIEVTPLDASGIVRMAIENIFENYRAEPHRLDAFYRTTMHDNQSVTRLLEAAVHITDAKGTVYGDRALDIRQIRKSNDLRKDKWKTSDGYIFHLVRNHPLQAQAWDFLKRGQLSDFHIELDETRFQDKEVFYVIKMMAKKPSPRFQYDVQLTVSERNFAIVDIIIFWKPELSNNYTWAWEQRDSAKFVADWQQSHYTFQEFEGKYYLKSSQWHRKGKVVSKIDNKILFKTESIDELLVTNIEKGRFSNVTRNFGTTDVYLIADKIPYNENFWRTYTRPVDSDHFTKAKRQLERNEPLESQFQKNTGIAPPPASQSTPPKRLRKNQ
jgi:hypothetical protein